MEEKKMTDEKNKKPIPGMKNLRRFTSEEAREIGKLGAARSAQVRREKKKLRQLLEIALAMPSPTGKTYAEEIVASLIEAARDGDVRAFVEIRDTIGEKPKQEVEQQFSGGILVKWGGDSGTDND